MYINYRISNGIAGDLLVQGQNEHTLNWNTLHHFALNAMHAAYETANLYACKASLKTLKPVVVYAPGGKGVSVWHKGKKSEN